MARHGRGGVGGGSSGVEIWSADGSTGGADGAAAASTAAGGEERGWLGGLQHGRCGGVVGGAGVGDGGSAGWPRVGAVAAAGGQGRLRLGGWRHAPGNAGTSSGREGGDRSTGGGTAALLRPRGGEGAPSVRPTAARASGARVADRGARTGAASRGEGWGVAMARRETVPAQQRRHRPLWGGAQAHSGWRHGGAMAAVTVEGGGESMDRWVAKRPWWRRRRQSGGANCQRLRGWGRARGDGIDRG